MSMVKRLCGLVLAAVGLWSSPTWSATAVFLDSEPGDYIGDGRQWHFASPEDSIAVLHTYANSISVRVTSSSWILDFSAVDRLAKGNYADADLKISGNGHGCNRGYGWFEVIELERDDANQIRQLAIDFVYHCDSQEPGLYGAVRINSEVPLRRIRPAAIAGPVQHVTEGQRVSLDGSGSFSRSGAVNFAWSQVAGPQVVLDDPTIPAPRFQAPLLEPGGATLTFRLTVTDGEGRHDSDDVDVIVHDVSDPRTRVVLDSEAVDYIGLGFRWVFDEVNTVLHAQSSPRVIRIALRGKTAWDLEFEAAEGDELRRGKFGSATRAGFASSVRPGLDISGEGRGCNTVFGWFDIRELRLKPDGSIDVLAIDFVQTCNDSAARLIGALRINSSIPLERRKPVALAGLDQVAAEGDRVRLDGRQSTDLRTGGLMTYRWTQVDGPAVDLGDADRPTPSFRAPSIRPGRGGVELEFELRVADATGRTDVDRTRVHVESRSDPRIYIHLKSEPGDYVGEGLERTFRPSDGNFGIFRNYDNGVSVKFDGDLSRGELWYLDFAAAGAAPLEPGAYERAQKWPHQADERPGLSVAGIQGCNRITGRFDVLRAVYVGTGTVGSFAADFEQHCEGADPALRGEVRINAIDPSVPNADAGGDFTRSSGLRVALDGSGSADADGVLVAYDWRQVSGPVVDLRHARQVAADFDAPVVTDAQTFVFELMVTDDAGFRALDQVRVTVIP